MKVENSQVQFTEQDIINILNYYKQNYNTKYCRQIKFENSLTDIESKEYNKYVSSCSCVKPLVLLIYSIIIFAFALTGFFFLISKNEGYKAYKEILERNISLINNEFPNELETKRLVSFLTKDENDKSCTYLRYSLSLCKFNEYKQFCTLKNYKENKCNYMDRRKNGGFSFICNYNNYKSGQCNHLQYIDYLKANNRYSDDAKIKFTIDSSDVHINLTSFSSQKKFCEIGKYDKPIYLSFLIIMIVFIILLIFDLIVKRRTILSCILYYYIMITFYIIYYIIFRIYVILFLAISIYGAYVCVIHPTTAKETVKDPFFSKKEVILLPWEQLWKDKRINAFIFCGISFILFIMITILCFYKKLIYNYLSFYFDEKNEANDFTILRNASINLRERSYNFLIKQNSELYLTENISKKKHKFKEVFDDENNVYYLKCDNLDIKHQLSWNELRYPNIDIVFKKFTEIFHLYFVIIFLLIAFGIWNFEDDITFEYYMQLIELGYKPDGYKFFKISHKYSPIILKFIYISEAVYGIIILLFIGKFLIFGGFKNSILKRFIIFISIILVLYNLIVALISIAGGGFCLVTFLNFSDINIIFEDDRYLTNYQYYLMNLHFYFFTFLFSLTLFIYSIKLVSSLNLVINENQKLERNNDISEDKFHYISFDEHNYILEAVNNRGDLPKHLFYKKKVNSNPLELALPLIPQLSELVLCLEKNTAEIFDVAQNIEFELNNYNYKFFNTKRIVAKIVFNIIISSISIVFTIGGLSYSFKNNKYYKKYREFLDYMVKNSEEDDITNFNFVLTGYSKFWYDFGNFENNILISFLLFLVLFLSFEIFSLLIQKNVIKFVNPSTIYYNIFSLVNIIFYILFKIYFPLLLYLCIYSLLTMYITPYGSLISGDKDNGSFFKKIDEEWDNKNFYLYINVVIKLLLIVFDNKLINIKYCIIDYLNRNYEEDYDDNEININKQAGINTVSTSIVIDDCKYNTNIKLNEILYLQQINNISFGKIFKFKKINIENVTNNFIYVRLGPNSITDQISLAQWNYPDLNEIFIKLCEICNHIFYILLFSYPLFILHVKDENIYKILKLYNKTVDKLYDIHENNEINVKKKVAFSNIFNMYGSFEEKTTNARFILFIIELAILVLFIIKRTYFGGFSKIIYIIISFIVSIISFVLNIALMILGFLIILFTFLTLISYDKSEEFRKTIPDNVTFMFEAKIYLQIILNIIIIINDIKLIRGNYSLISDLNKLRKEMVKFNKREDNIEENMPNFKPLEFKYISRDGNICSIKEIKNDLLQRYLYYSSENSQEPENTQVNINPLEENEVSSVNNLKTSQVNKKKRKTIKEKENNDINSDSTTRKKLDQ